MPTKKLKKKRNVEHKRPFRVYYEVEFIGDGDHDTLGEKYTSNYRAFGYADPLTLSQAKTVLKKYSGNKIIKVSRTYI